MNGYDIVRELYGKLRAGEITKQEQLKLVNHFSDIGMYGHAAKLAEEFGMNEHSRELSTKAIKDARQKGNFEDSLAFLIQQ